MDKRILSTTEVAKILGISRQAMLKKIVSGEIKAKKSAGILNLLIFLLKE